MKRTAIAVALAWVAAGTPALPAADHPMLGEEAPGFALESLSGDTVRLQDFRGKTIVLHFGTGW